MEALFPSNIRGSLHFEKFLFLGPPGTKTNNHFDLSDNFVFCAYGIKHVALMPPGSEKEMSNISDELRHTLGRGDCYFMDDGPNFMLDLNSSTDDVTGDVQYNYMHNHSVLHSCKTLLYSPLYPGDLVYFPARWFHYFHNITPTISVTIQSHRMPAMNDD